MSVDTRAILVIKTALNKHFDNKSSENLSIAGIIAEFSHRSFIEPGDAFECFYPNVGSCFYIISKLYSPFWAQVYWMPSTSRIYYHRTLYFPNYAKASRAHKKRIFDPFSDNPFIRQRGHKHTLLDKHNRAIIIAAE